MKNLIQLILGIAVITAITSCGGGNSLDAKKAKLEKLKSQQIEISEAIKTLEQDIASAGDSTTNVDDDVRAKFIAVRPVNVGVFEHSIDVNGRVEGDENVTLTAKMGGSVDKIYVKAGDKVSVGQVLAEIEHDITSAQLADLKANLELAREVFNKQSKLWEQKVGTEIQFLQAKTNKESLEQKLTQLAEQEKMYKVISPISGIVDDMSLKIGQVVAPGTPAARVVNFGKLKVKAEVSESYATQIEEGNQVKLNFPDINKSVESSVSYASKVINPMTRTFTVEIALPSDNSYRPNMVAQIKVINYKNDKAICVPINTVQKIDGVDVVFVAVEEGGKLLAKKREVKVGSTYGDKTEILEGLSEGAQLITTGFQDLTENQIVKF